jgi:hypothetical protein
MHPEIMIELCFGMKIGMFNFQCRVEVIKQNAAFQAKGAFGKEHRPDKTLEI